MIFFSFLIVCGVDRFANMNNTKLLRFNSLYWNFGFIGVDAFTSDWSDENNWLVPPVSMVSRVINHLIIKSNSVGTLVMPKWPSSLFWPLLFYTGLILQTVCHRRFRILQPGNNVNSLFVRSDFIGKILAVKLDASVC